MDLIERFLSYSELVGNANSVISASELRLLLATDALEAPYVKAVRFGLETREPDITQTGIAEAVVEADYAIAETGTVVIDSADEKLRLATCLADKLTVIVEASRLKETLEDIVPFLEELSAKENAYVAFISGASRTADIERVLTIGVHGPKQMHVIIVNDR